ncbi:MAG: hypothetical protein ABIH21_03440 [Patescibacteria group bacterium]
MSEHKKGKARSRIVLKPGHALVQTQIQRSNLTWNRFLKTIRGQMVFKTPLLPSPGMRMLVEGNGKLIVVYEEEPQLHTIEVDMEVIEDKGSFLLAFPFMVYVIVLDVSRKRMFKYKEMSCFFRPSAIASLDNYLFYPSLPNLYAGDGAGDGDGSILGAGEVCMGDIQEQIACSADIGEVIRDAVLHFWSAEFNTDITGVLDYYRGFPKDPFYDKRLSSFKQWEQASKAEESFILSVRMMRVGKMRKVLQVLMEEINIGRPLGFDRLAMLLSKQRETMWRRP